MNDQSRGELQRLVETIVGPLVASRGGKRQMREELFAHLSGVFDEELSRTGAESAALAATITRFGTPTDVTRELQQAVSPWNRLRSHWETLPLVIFSIALTILVNLLLWSLVTQFAFVQKMLDQDLSILILMSLLEALATGAILAHMRFVTWPLFTVPVGAMATKARLAIYCYNESLWLSVAASPIAFGLATLAGYWIARRRTSSPAIEPSAN